MWVEVDSSNIKRVKYSGKGNSLKVEFHNGSYYKYSGVTQEEYNAFMKAESKGAWFYKNIRTNPDHPAEKL